MTGKPTAKTCPVCGSPRNRDFDPFCSGRCADADLLKWLKGYYSVPGVAIDEIDDDEAPRPAADKGRGRK